MTDTDGYDPCPFCWGTGVITIMEPTIVFPEGSPAGYTLGDVAVPRPCPEGCMAPDEVPF